MPASRVSVRVPVWRRRALDGSAGGGGGAAQSPASSSGLVRAVAVAEASGIFVVTFSITNLAASLSASQLLREGLTLPIEMAFRGYIAALALTSTEAKSAGTASFEVFLEGAASGAKLDWTTGLTEQVAVFTKNQFGFVADQKLDVRVTTNGSYTPTTADVVLDAYLVASTEAPTT